MDTSIFKERIYPWLDKLTTRIGDDLALVNLKEQLELMFDAVEVNDCWPQPGSAPIDDSEPSFLPEPTPEDPPEVKAEHRRLWLSTSDWLRTIENDKSADPRLRMVARKERRWDDDHSGAQEAFDANWQAEIFATIRCVKTLIAIERRYPKDKDLRVIVAACFVGKLWEDEMHREEILDLFSDGEQPSKQL